MFNQMKTPEPDEELIDNWNVTEEDFQMNSKSKKKSFLEFESTIEEPLLSS